MIVKQIERHDVSGGSRPGYDAIEDASLRRISLGSWEAWDWLISDRVHMNGVPLHATFRQRRVDWVIKLNQLPFCVALCPE